MWKSIIVIKPDKIWKFTPEVEGKFFRLRHINPPLSPMGWLGQAESIPNTNFHNFFGIQRVNGLSVFECLEAKKPPIFETRKLGFRQESRLANDWLIEVEVCLEMPSYSLDDPAVINAAASSTKNVTTVPVSTTITRILSANPNRKGVKFSSQDKLRSVYLDTDNIVSPTNAIESLTPSKPISVPSINWLGEWFAVASSGTVSIEVEEYL